MSLFTVETDISGRLSRHATRRLFRRQSAPLLHDGERGRLRTLLAPLKAARVARVDSTGHDVEVFETGSEDISVVVPLAGRMTSLAGAAQVAAGPGEALMFEPGARRTRVEPRAAPLYRAAVLMMPRAQLGPAAARVGAARKVAVPALPRLLSATLAELGRPDSLLSRPRARTHAEAMLVELLAEVLTPADEGPEALPIERVRQAEEIMRARHGDIVSLAEVAAEVGVGLRSLQAAFAAVTGESPRARLAAVRLDAARERLASAAPGETVTDVALDCGFSHLGRFAAAYRSRFGEAPSETLRRARG